jgi:hypothetical protein
MTHTALHVAWLSPDNAIDTKSDLAATVMLSGEGWERHGAQFSSIDDGEGEIVHSAGGVCTTSVGDIAFRVWDYGDEPTTYLLVEGELSERPALTELVVAQMRRDGILGKEVEVALFANHGTPAETQRYDVPSTELQYLLEGAYSRRARGERGVRARALIAQRRELVVAAARDLIAVPIALVVTVGLTVTSAFNNWGLSLVPRIGVVALGAILVIPLLISVVSLLRLSLFRDALATRSSPLQNPEGDAQTDAGEELAEA